MSKIQYKTSESDKFNWKKVNTDDYHFDNDEMMGFLGLEEIDGEEYNLSIHQNNENEMKDKVELDEEKNQILLQQQLLLPLVLKRKEHVVMKRKKKRKKEMLKRKREEKAAKKRKLKEQQQKSSNNNQQIVKQQSNSKINEYNSNMIEWKNNLHKNLLMIFY